VLQLAHITSLVSCSHNCNFYASHIRLSLPTWPSPLLRWISFCTWIHLWGFIFSWHIYWCGCGDFVWSMMD